MIKALRENQVLESKGAQGEDGPKGQQGEPGIGLKGAQGEDGPKGQQGEEGPLGIIRRFKYSNSTFRW